MTRETLDRKLKDLLDEVILLGSMVEEATLNGIRALKNHDLEASRKVYLGDKAINDKRFELEERTITIIATQQPMARDLRTLTAILEVITELERMGDYAKGIGRITLSIGNEGQLTPPPELEKMAELGVEMLHQALQAFASGDEDAARKIPAKDDKVDELFNIVHNALLKRMASATETVEEYNRLLWASHNLERLADRVTNICERTIFIATGQLLELDSSDDEIQ
jgi:phosphate transport system protein